MSGQCLSASGAGRALTPARHLRLGGPSPHQPANTARAPPGAADLWSCDVIGNYPVSRRAMPDPRIGRPRTPAPSAASPPCGGFARLACLIHAANVRSEPGSNPSKVSSARVAPGSFTQAVHPANRVRTGSQLRLAGVSPGRPRRQPPDTATRPGPTLHTNTSPSCQRSRCDVASRSELLLAPSRTTDSHR